LSDPPLPRRVAAEKLNPYVFRNLSQGQGTSVPRQNNSRGGGRQRRQAAFERGATQHHEFIGEAAPERAEAERQKLAHLHEFEEQEAVRAMAAELQHLADRDSRPLRVPRSREEAIDLYDRLRDEARDRLDEMPKLAQERLQRMPAPVRGAVHVAQNAAVVLLVPLRAGYALVSDLLRMPGNMFRILTRQEA
jgi:hypothetical protein